jgi:hypothetical protein
MEGANVISFDAADGWIEPSYGEPHERVTTGAFLGRIGDVDITRVEDAITKTVRPHIYAPMSRVAEWLLLNWWRLRWEPARAGSPSPEWLHAHRLSAIGGDHAWPALEFASEGEWIHVALAPEGGRNASAVRFLSTVDTRIAPTDFEHAVDRFLDLVIGRLAERLPSDRTLADLRAELTEERSDPTLTRDCKLQALAGFHPGDVEEAWLERAHRLVDGLGTQGEEALLAALPEIPGGLDEAEATLAQLKSSSTSIDLSSIPLASRVASDHHEQPWQRAARHARTLRTTLGWKEDRITTEELGELLGTRIPLDGEPAKRAVRGGYRADPTRTNILVPSRIESSQRFFLARLIGAAGLLGEGERLLAVTESKTSLQKYQRAFAQELLCPWDRLDAFTDESGTDDDGVREAALRFGVSELCVVSTLVNRRKISRESLQ